MKPGRCFDEVEGQQALRNRRAIGEQMKQASMATLTMFGTATLCYSLNARTRLRFSRVAEWLMCRLKSRSHAPSTKRSCDVDNCESTKLVSTVSSACVSAGEPEAKVCVGIGSFARVPCIATTYICLHVL